MQIPRGVVAEYKAPGRVNGGQVRARFGGRGRIDVEFEQEGEPFVWMPPPRCEGAPRTYRSGVFVGTIGFHGERGFTAVDVSSVKGTLKTIPDWKCAGPPPIPPIQAVPSIDTSPAVLGATKGRRGHRVFFQAIAARGPGEKGVTSFTGGRIEARPGLRIRRFGFVWSMRDRSFLFDDRLTGATLDPPPPFDGSATFTRGAGGTSWRGPLTVDLPGVGPLRLAGEGFTARLYRGHAEDSPGY